jgi:glycosyltransferase involved in cell wall biosynthesis
MRAAGVGPARLSAAGYLAPEHRGYLEKVEAALEAAGVRSEFRYHGTLDRAGKMEFLRSLDVASLPTPYAEPKGLSVLEALACGVPAVVPDHGAFPEIVARTAGGVLFPPGDTDALAAELRGLSADPARRRALGVRGARGVREEYSAARMAERALAVYQEAIAEARPAATA